MSGTSADAIDAALVDITPTSIRVLASESLSIPSAVREAILSLFTPSHNEIDRLGSLDIRIAHLFANAVHRLLEQASVKAADVHAIGSHGQTLRHRPRPADGRPFTLQVGDPNTIAELTGITTVADFRRRDIACGGQGAPLAPGFHQAAFSHPLQSRCVLNIGGIANITVLKPGHPTLGFDTGPGNGLMDAWTEQCRQQPFDRDGAWAASGAVQHDLLSRLRRHPYFALSAPKSTGREEFTLDWLQSELCHFGNLREQDVQATLAELTAVTVSEQVVRCGVVSCVYVCGGGAHNGHLLDRMRHHLRNCELASTDALGVPPKDVEAAAFAWLAHQTMNNLPGNQPSVTGARRLAVVGAIYPGS